MLDSKDPEELRCQLTALRKAECPGDAAEGRRREGATDLVLVARATTADKGGSDQCGNDFVVARRNGTLDATVAVGHVGCLGCNHAAFPGTGGRARQGVKLMRKLLILATMALAALAVLAPTSSAETEAPTAPSTVGQVSEEETATECPAISKTGHEITDGCEVHATGEAIEMWGHSIFGETLEARCNNEFVGHVGPDGEGWIPFGSVNITPAPNHSGTSNCDAASGGIQACDEATAAEESHANSGDWHIQGFEDTDGSLWMEVNLCLENTSQGTVHGDLWVPVTENTNGHVTGFEAEDHRLRNAHGLGSGIDAEFDGHWAIESSETNNDRLIVTHP